MSKRRSEGCAGFTLLEVLVALTVLAVGAALTLSVISGALGNVRKVQMRTRLIQHAGTVMELALLDDTVQGPTTLNGDFEDGTQWSVIVDDYVVPEEQQMLQTQQPMLPLKLLSYSVTILGPGSTTPDFQVSSLKLVPVKELGVQLPR
jgi:prepilin-type N-terminal cleavage/methylation domain-containing protein